MDIVQIILGLLVLNVIALAIINVAQHRDLRTAKAKIVELEALGSGTAYREMVVSRDKAYAERNELAIALAHVALHAGLKAGRGVDPTAPPTWDPPYLRVVYVELPDGKQVSWHMGPDNLKSWEALDEYLGEWDGTFLGRMPEWSLQVDWKHADPYKTMARQVFASEGEIISGRRYESPAALGAPYGKGQK